MVEFFPESCILVELCIGRVLFGRNVSSLVLKKKLVK